MASSSELYAKYLEHKQKALDYGERLKRMESIKAELIHDAVYHVRESNAKVKELDTKVTEMLRKNQEFDRIAELTMEYCEKDMETDTDLSATFTGIEKEIQRLGKILDYEICQREYFYSAYESALAREQEEARRAEEARMAEVASRNAKQSKTAGGPAITVSFKKSSKRK